MHEEDAAALRDFLASRDVPCPGCGYNLRGLTGGRCPKCAQHLELRVGPPEPQAGVFLAGLVGLAIGAGFSGLLLVYALIRTALSGFHSMLPGFLILVTISGLIQTCLLIAWLRYRSAFHRQSSPLQRLLVAGGWAITLVNLIVFTALIR